MHALYFVLGYLCGVVSVAAVAVLGEWLAARAAHYPPVESPNDVLLARMRARADALDIERVLTREECAAIDRLVGM